MVRKLLKYDFIAMTRMLFPACIIVLAIAGINRIIQFFENDTAVYNIVFDSSVAALVIAVVVLLVCSIIFGITYFYKNLFTGEGYLTFTLPVRTGQIIFSKVFVAVAYFVITVAVSLAALFIATAGEVLSELFKAAGYVLALFTDAFGYHTAVWIFLFVIGCILFAALKFLLFYGCISIGQMAHKSRKLAAFGVYFGYYLFKQIIGTVFIILFTLFGDRIPWDAIEDFASNHEIAFIYIIFGFVLLLAALFTVIYFIVTQYMTSKHLNLE